ncbi:MAG: ABC-2 family transporter protein [bacterium]
MIQFKTLKNYISLSWYLVKTNLLSAMEYRHSFIIQVLGMAFNDVALISMWLIFFSRIGSLNGWQFSDTILLFVMGTINFGISMTAGQGAFDIAKNIASGNLDNFLVTPKNPLWFVSFSRIDVSAVGDLLFGLGLYWFYPLANFGGFMWVVLLGIITAPIAWAFIVITQSISFWVGNFEDAAEQWFWNFIGFTLYPASVFHGFLKVIFMTIMPAFFIVALPVELIKHFSWGAFLLLIAFDVFICWLATYVFNKGLKRYESGNLINVKL